MMSVLGTAVRFLSSPSPFLAFSGVFESVSVCVSGVILPIMQCAEALWGIG